MTVERSPVQAGKDPRVPDYLAAAPAARVPLDAVADALVALMRGLLPHAWLGDEVYRAVVAKIEVEPGHAETLRAECLAIEERLGRPVAALPPDEVRRLLVSLGDGPFLRILLGRSVRHLYDDPVVWAGCGYEGVHGCRGGEPRDGIADAAWLPDPTLS